MKKDYYYVYCEGILGVKTNIRNFKWIYGNSAPFSTKVDYEKCIVKFDICVRNESTLEKPHLVSEKFQSFFWSNENQTLYYKRKIFSFINLIFNLNLDKEVVKINIGKMYFKCVKYKIMNLHSMYYLLSDIANIYLLKNGFLTLYASSVYYNKLKKGVLIFGAPNTGKTLTISKCCELYKYDFLGEDIAITDGKRIYSCPWTNSYRKKKSLIDSSGSIRRQKKHFDNKIKDCEITDIVVLSIGDQNLTTSKEEILKKINVLNGYLFGYYSTPIIKVIGYFCENFYKPWQNISFEILDKMLNDFNGVAIKSENSVDFYKILHRYLNGELL